MGKFWVCAAVGFYLLPLCLAQIGLNISCRYAGVFHVEKNHRYSLTKEDAVELCKALNSTIPTFEQMQKAFDLGFETCRYGYIEDKVVVPRHTPYHLCAANNTGIYVLTSNVSDRYDTYCFNSSEPRDKVCDPVIKLYSVWLNNNSTIEIFNADGSRYIEGEKYTDRPPVTEDETSAGSGSANDRGTTESNFITHGVSQYPHPSDSTPQLIDGDEDSDHHGGHSEDQHPQSTTVVLSKDVKHEDSAHDSLLHGVHSEKDSEVRYSTNGTKEDVLPGIGPLGDSEHYSTTTAVSSSDGFSKQEDPNRHPQDGGHSGLDTEDTEPAATTKSDLLPTELVPSSEKENMLGKGDVHHTVTFSSESVRHEEADEDQLSAMGQPGWRSQESSTTNRTISDVLKILTSPNEHDGENEPSQTADEVSNDGTKHEESTQDSVSYGAHPEWASEETHLSNTSGKEMVPEIIPPAENEHKNESFYTAVIPTSSTNFEESSHGTVLHREHSEWDTEDKYPTNTSGEHLLPGILHPTESEHGKESSHTGTSQEKIPDSSDDGKHEDAVHDPVLHEERETEDYTNNTKDDIILGNIPPTGYSSDDTNFHTVLIHNDPEDSTQQPLLPTHQPGWDPEEKYLTNTSRDDALVEVDTEIKSEHDLSFTDVVIHGTKEDSTLEPVSQWGSEDQYTTQSPADVLVPGIVPRRGINQKNKTDHTAGVSSGGAKREDSTQHPSMHGLYPGGSSGDVNNTEDYRIPGVFSEVDSDSNSHSSPSTASIDPDEHGKGVSHTGKHVTPLPGDLPKSQPRMSHIPDWLIVVASLLALALILGVCIAVNSRRRCGQKKKLVINNGKGGIDEKNMGGLNGEASKSQEMVHLVHKEKSEDQIGSHDEFLAIDETQNQQDVALKSGM